MGLLVVVVVTVAAGHWPALSAGALSFDDNMYLTSNPLVQNPSWASAGRLLGEVLQPSTVRGYYQPLTMISLMLDWQMGGRPDQLMPFHRTSLLLHLANTALVVLLLHALIRRPLIAALLGVLFGLHPLTVEPIPWVGERKTLLAALFSLAALLLYVRYARARRKSAYIACAVAYVLALLAKPTATPLPVAFLLLDLWPLARMPVLRWSHLRPRLLEKIPFFALAALAAVITVISQARAGHVTAPGEYPPGHIALVVCHNIVFYLWKIVWPVNLSPHYPFPNPMTLAQPALAIGVVGTCLLIPALLILWRWTRAPLVGWLVFFVLILPTLGIIGFTTVMTSDKYVYLPAVGLLLVLASGATWLWDRRAARTVRTLVVGVAVVLAALEFVQTRRTYVPWRDTEDLYRHMLALAPDAQNVHFNLAICLNDRGRIDEAVTHFERVLALNPGHWMCDNELGEICRKRGDLDRAIAYFKQALQSNPEFVPALNNLGLAYIDQGRPADAIVQLDEALRIKSDHYSAYLNKGNALCRLGRLDEAVTQYHLALQIKPDHARTYFNLGLALQQLGRRDEAIAAFRDAVRYKPDYESAQQQLNAALQARPAASQP